MRRIDAAGTGVLVYLRAHERRGIGLARKLAVYELQDMGQDTIESPLRHALPWTFWLNGPVTMSAAPTCHQRSAGGVGAHRRSVVITTSRFSWSVRRELEDGLVRQLRCPVED